MRKGVYVGSFDPVHKGHKMVVDYLLKNNYVDSIIVIPTGSYWDKNKMIDVSYRIEMWNCYKDDRIIIDGRYSDLEYTYMILDKLSGNGDDELYLIIGADNIICFDKWKNYQEIINNNKILIIPRNGIDIKDNIYKYDNRDNFIVVDEFCEMDVSSREIRKLLMNKRYDEVEKYLDKEVIEYIKKNKLYLN